MQMMASQRHVAAAAQQHIDDDHFVWRTRREAIGAGQIDQCPAAAGMMQMADFFLDRDAGIVADALAHAGQRGEERRFAGVGIADQRDGERALFRGDRHGLTADTGAASLGSVELECSSSTRWASLRRTLSR